MNKIKRILLYSITIVVIVFAFVWEYMIKQWQAVQPDGGESVVRTDSFVLWPLIITLVAVSLFTLLRKRKE
ncbi:MAG: hypothetical protein JKY22_05230 [Flavobacteriaceae bacterium]|nr:hypothetical protein [Flavobacteriaceae bacterium]